MTAATSDSASPDVAAMAPLLLMRLIPDLAALARWAAATGQRALREDTGYALHAALRAALGDRAPKPFALVQRPGNVQLIGYTTDTSESVQAAIEMAPVTDPGAALALGLAPSTGVLLKRMPDAWRAGELMSFEARVAPVVRSRSRQEDAYPEIDAAFHPDYAGDALGDREIAHGRWLARELARGGAATLQTHRAVAFQLAPMARRAARGEFQGSAHVRRVHTGLLPDLTVRGQLRVEDSLAFQALLARGLGRHRSFGFGCLLLAPPGAWT
jgi:CRISPR system Cascade subunit CasE